MKKLTVSGLFLAGVLLCSGCGVKSDADTTTLYVEGSGKIEELTVEAFDKDYYDEEELKTYIDKEVDSYKKDGGTGNVKVKKCAVKDQVVKLLMEYDSAESYASFNDTEFYTGTILKAQADGYEFDLDFYAPQKENTKKEKVSDTEETVGSVQEAVAISDVLAEDDNKVVILQQDTAVEVKGEILYVSEHVEVTGKNTANVSGEGADSADAKTAYIIYK